MCFLRCGRYPSMYCSLRHRMAAVRDVDVVVHAEGMKRDLASAGGLKPGDLGHSSLLL